MKQGYKVVLVYKDDSGMEHYYSAVTRESSMVEYIPGIPAYPNDHLRELGSCLFVYDDLNDAIDLLSTLRSISYQNEFQIWHCNYEEANMPVRYASITTSYATFWRNYSEICAKNILRNNVTSVAFARSVTLIEEV